MDNTLLFLRCSTEELAGLPDGCGIQAIANVRNLLDYLPTNLIAIHDRKDGNRLGYYLFMHHKAYKEFTQEPGNSSECIRYLCNFGHPTVVQLKNWSANTQASLDTQAASLRKLQGSF